MAVKLNENNLGVILVQIDEAHSSAWPMAIDSSVGVPQPEPQQTFADRCSRANEFNDKYNPPYPVYVDDWDNTFANKFRAWPDKFYCVDKNMVVVAKSEYHRDGEKEAVIVDDYTCVLERFCNK